jgi:hypothetical protein
LRSFQHLSLRSSDFIFTAVKRSASVISSPPKAARVFLYQLAFVTPGISPASASFRKQMRHKENLRKKPRGRPQLLQRFRSRILNFGFFSSFAIFAVVAIHSNLTDGTACP